MLLAEVAPARFLSMQRILAHQFGKLEEVSHATGLLQRLVQRLAVTEHSHIGVVLLPKCGDLRERLLQPWTVTGHPTVIPHDSTQLAVEPVHAPGPLY